MGPSNPARRTQTNEDRAEFLRVLTRLNRASKHLIKTFVARPRCQGPRHRPTQRGWQMSAISLRT